MDRFGRTHNQGHAAPTVVVASGESDELLAARAVTDPAAFGELYLRYVGRIDRYCRYRLHDPELARDATSQVFLKALENLSRRRNGNVASWLFSIAHNEVVDRYRRQRHDTDFDLLEDSASPDLSPEHLAIASSESQDLRNLLPLLTPDQRHVVELRLAGLTTDEIQNVLGKGKSWIRTTQHRALRRLRELIDAGQAGEGVR